MISIEAAKKFARDNFPNGPEALAEKLGILVRESSLVGCDGWVLSGPSGVLIRLNSDMVLARRRFTLAHELGHLLLGVPTVIGESVYESLRSNNVEERAVNDLASELLLPQSVVAEQLTELPIVAQRLTKLAKLARISELAAAIRVANLAETLGLQNASVAFFKQGNFQWQWSRTLEMPNDVAVTLLDQAKKTDPQPTRLHRKKTSDVIVASLITNPHFASEILFVQLLPLEAGNRLSREERRQELEQYLFQDDNQFRMQLQGVFGSFRPKCAGLRLDAAFELFYETKGDRWAGPRRTRLKSDKGREYVRLRLQEWCS